MRSHDWPSTPLQVAQEGYRRAFSGHLPSCRQGISLCSPRPSRRGRELPVFHKVTIAASVYTQPAKRGQMQDLAWLSIVRPNRVHNPRAALRRRLFAKPSAASYFMAFGEARSQVDCMGPTVIDTHHSHTILVVRFVWLVTLQFFWIIRIRIQSRR